ncbi:Metallo-dependent phosphatase [Sistotremastrum suecicum HHB10207 ss-3]|uniref:Metallo-dependent phosphatase n=1 Tax=Sistotremastrum suecicum HHB10207 ss-3 TaxID=1314776 RepID=A0A166EWA3_9AGAM|nr:Metallo-dependent phosphatase [Sistotremastrum suecicum HHB10207 ss-3]
MFSLACIAFLAGYLWTKSSSDDEALPSFPPANATYTRTIVAVGDLHSHYPNALKVLQMADVVDSKGDWSGNVDYFVQTGDMVDRGGDTIQLYRWFEDLRVQAANAGGHLISHYGNHEIMNLIGDWRYVYPDDLASFGSIAKRQHAMSRFGWLGRAWAQNYSITTRLPLHPSLGPHDTDFEESSSTSGALSHAAISFVHGGISPTSNLLTPYPSRINAIGRSFVSRLHSRYPQPQPFPPGPYPGLPAGTTQEEFELYGSDGPLWYRGWAQEQETAAFCKQADEVMKKIGVRRLIMGHTPDLEQITSRCDGRVVIIDTGITPAYGGILSALRIQYALTPIAASSQLADSLEAVNATADDTSQAVLSINREKSKWNELEIVTAIYKDRKTLVAKSERVIEGNFW